MCCSSLLHSSLEPGVDSHPFDTLGAGLRSKTLHLWVIEIILFYAGTGKMVHLE